MSTDASSPMGIYRHMVDQLAAIRTRNHGLYSQDEGCLLEEMTAVWLELDERETVIAEWLVQTVPTASRLSSPLDSDFMLPGADHKTMMMGRRAG